MMGSKIISQLLHGSHCFWIDFSGRSRACAIPFKPFFSKHVSKSLRHLASIAVLNAYKKNFFLHTSIFFMTVAEAGQTEPNFEVALMAEGTSSREMMR